MKKLNVGLVLLLGVVASASALDRAELDKRIRLLSAKLDALQHKPDKTIPAEKFRKACGIVLLDRTKAGFLFAYQGGGGVAMVKEPGTDRWGPVAFLGAAEASLGFQIGGEQNFYVILFMNTNATRMLTEANFQFGGEARGTAGDNSSGVGADVVPEPSILVYDDRMGLYGGAAIKGGGLSTDLEANRAYYNSALSPREILFEGKVKPTEAASELAERLRGYAKPAAASRE